MQAKTGDLDGYMSLTIREGFVFDRAGWYQDLKPFIENKALTEANWNYEDFGAGLRSAHTINGKVVTIPINSEGPLFYWRKDIFEKCKVPEPKFLEDIPEAAKALKACRSAVSNAPNWVVLKPATWVALNTLACKVVRASTCAVVNMPI
jgi:multiple sugar transport system substrate-binding protein